MSLLTFCHFQHTYFFYAKLNVLFLLCAKLTDYFFTFQKEQIAFYLCNMNRIVSSLQKVKTFFFYSDNLTDCFFAAESEEIGFFTAGK